MSLTRLEQAHERSLALQFRSGASKLSEDSRMLALRQDACRRRNNAEFACDFLRTTTSHCCEECLRASPRPDETPIHTE